MNWRQSSEMTHKSTHSRVLAVLMLVLLTTIVVACSSSTEEEGPVVTRALPTIDPIFRTDGLSNLDAETVAETTPEPTIPRPTRTPFPTPPPQPDLPPPIPIYDDQLAFGWSTKYSSMEHDLAHDVETFEGQNAIRITPRVGGRTILFTLDKNARPIREDRVLGIRFQLYSGDEGLSIEEFGMTIIGSDQSTYWEKSDRSVLNVRNPNPDWLPEDDPISNLYAQDFSETLLGFLGVSRDIPPNVWVEGFNQLDERIYDPLYKNITGFYFKTETTVRHDLLIDDIELVVLGADADQ